MKKVVQFVLKLVALAAALAAVACCVIAYWDKITELFGCARERLAEKRACCCHRSEYDDYADWDEE